MKLNSIATKIFITSFSTIIFVFVLVSGISFTLVPLLYTNYQKVELEKTASTVIETLKASDPSEFKFILDQTVTDKNTKIQIIRQTEDGTQKIYNKSPYDNDSVVNFGNFIGSDLQGVPKVHEAPPQQSDFDNSIYKSYETPNGDIYTIIFSKVNLQTKQIRNLLSNLFPYILVMAAFLTLIITFVFSKVYTNPIIKVTKKANQFASLNFDIEFQNYSNDEIGDLNRNIDQMSVQLKVAIEKLNRDVEIAQQMEKERRSQLAVMSHELKTPLTILKGQTELMIQNLGKYKDRDFYLKENLNKIDKMQNLIADMLLTSDMDSMEVVKNASSYNIVAKIKDLIRDLEALDSTITIEFNYSNEDLVENINSTIFDQVLKNIIENAIKYSEPNTTIKVVYSNRILSVSNVNSTIQNSDLERIYEPFVRLDKSRNSTKGGHGLGLYITKKGLDLHQLNFEMNVADSLVTFNIYF